MITKRVALLAVLGVGLLLAGCISVYPFYTEKDLVMDPALVGTWVTADTNGDQETWVFEKAGELGYKASVLKATETNVYTAHLFKLKGTMFLDALPVLENCSGVPSHFVIKVAQIQPTLKVALMNDDWLVALLKKNPSALRHINASGEPGNAESGDVILTGDTEELQGLIVKYANDTNAFVEIDEMKKK